MKFLRLVLRNVFRKKTRAALTIASIVLVLVLIVVLSSLLASLEGEDSAGLGATRIFVQHTAGLAQFLPLAYRHKIEGIRNVVAVTEEMWFNGTYIDERPQNFFGQLGADPVTWATIHEDYRIPKDQLRTWQGRRDSFIAGKQLVDRFHWKLGDRIQVQGSYIPITLDLVMAGVYEGSDESVIFYHYKYLENTWLGRAGQTGNFVLRVKRPADVPVVVDAINVLFENSSAPVKAMPEKQFRLQFVEMLGNVKFLVRSISLTVLFTIILIVANTMAMSARERVTEIAVLKALGFKRHHILALVLAEALVLALTGGVAGVLLSLPLTHALVEGMKQSPAATFAYNFRVSWSTVGMAFSAAVAIGTLSGFVPAVRSSRISVVGALRRVA
jgi:putative ABC transport system permease protein